MDEDMEGIHMAHLRLLRVVEEHHGLAAPAWQEALSEFQPDNGLYGSSV